MEKINDQIFLRKNSVVNKKIQTHNRLDSVLQYKMFKCYFFVLLIFSLTYATKDTTKGYKKWSIHFIQLSKIEIKLLKNFGKNFEHSKMQISIFPL